MAVTFNADISASHIYTYNFGTDTWGGGSPVTNYKYTAAFNYFNGAVGIDFVGSLCYFGFNTELGAFKNVKVRVGTIIAADAYATVWEYWNGSTWATLTVTDNTNAVTQDGTQSFAQTGQNSVVFTPPTNWRSKQITPSGSTDIFYIRVKGVSQTNLTNSGANSTTQCYIGDFCITVTGGTEASPNRMVDIYNADVSGGWGVCTRTGTYQYMVNCHLALGAWGNSGGTAGSLLIKDGEQVEFRGKVKLGGGAGTANTFVTGTLISAGDGTTSDACMLLLTREYSDDWYVFYNRVGTIKLYSTIIKGDLTATFYDEVTTGAAYNCIFEDLTIGYLSTMGRVNGSRPSHQAADTPSGTLSDLFFMNSSWGVRRPQNATSTINVSNLKLRGTTSVMRFSTGSAGTSTTNLINADLSGYTNLIYWDGAANTHNVNLRYTIDIQTVDRENVAIASAQVDLFNGSGTSIFSVTTAADGTITQQTVTAKNYVYASGSAPGVSTETNYNDFTLRIQKAGYETYVCKFTLNEKADWRIKLAHSPFIGGDGMGQVWA